MPPPPALAMRYLVGLSRLVADRVSHISTVRSPLAVEVTGIPRAGKFTGRQLAKLCSILFDSFDVRLRNIRSRFTLRVLSAAGRHSRHPEPPATSITYSRCLCTTVELPITHTFWDGAKSMGFRRLWVSRKERPSGARSFSGARS